MQRLQAYKYELKPSAAQRQKLVQFAGSCRKEEKLTWLKDKPAQALQQAIKDLERSYVNFFQKRTDFPKFKKRGIKDSFRYPQGRKIKLDEANNRIFLPKLGYIRYRNSRNIGGAISNVTVSLKAGKWFISIQTERKVAKPFPETSNIIGIDVGIARFATFSDGSCLEPLNSFKRHEVALRKAQQSLSRKEKFSRNWQKAKHKIQKIHYEVKGQQQEPAEVFILGDNPNLNAVRIPML